MQFSLVERIADGFEPATTGNSNCRWILRELVKDGFALLNHLHYPVLLIVVGR
jgi:hypothetical protein